MQPYEQLVAWQKSHTLFLLVYRLTAKWPKEEKYGLTSQARRAAFSVPANIVEGKARFGIPEFRKHLNIALGSLAELKYAFHAGRDLGMVTPEDHRTFLAAAEEASKCGHGLLKSLLNDKGGR
jgi:four helix bundle protein